MPETLKSNARVVVVWIDWYPYHVARLRGLLEALPNQVTGIELVGGTGVHTGLKFREELPLDLPVETLMRNTDWGAASKVKLAHMLWVRLSELNPEVVLVPGYYTLPALAAALWARVNRRASVLMTESTAGDHKRIWWRETIKSLGLKVLFDWAVSGGKAHVAYLHRLEFPADRVTGFYDVVDNAFFRHGTRAIREQSRSLLGLPTSRFFLYVGRLSPEKNVVTLLQSWLTYRLEGGTWPLVLVGDGPEAPTLKVIAAESPYCSDVLFAGLKSSQELLPFYALAGCFVLPSTREPWGLVVNEAMASALPVLVSSCSGCASDLVVPNRNGFLFDPLDRVSITGLLHKMELLGPEDRRRMGDASAVIIQKFSPTKFGQSIAAITTTRLETKPRRKALQASTGGSA